MTAEQKQALLDCFEAIEGEFEYLSKAAGLRIEASVREDINALHFALFPEKFVEESQ